MFLKLFSLPPMSFLKHLIFIFLFFNERGHQCWIPIAQAPMSRQYKFQLYFMPLNLIPSYNSHSVYS